MRPGGALLGQVVARRTALAGLVIALAIVAASILVPWLHGGDPVSGTEEDPHLAPNLAHPFGTDGLGRDLFLRVFAGGRISLFVAFTAVSLSMAVGLPLGALAGYLGGRTDAVLMRAVDVLLSFPSIVLAILLATSLGGASLVSLVLSVGIVGIPQFARQMRGEVLPLRDQEFVLSARALGCSHSRTLVRHVLPNTIAPLTVLATLRLGTAILEAAGLSFLGLGVEVGTPEWGTMIKIGRDEMHVSVWTALFPGLALTLTVLGFNLFGDGLRDALDPRTRRLKRS